MKQVMAVLMLLSGCGSAPLTGCPVGYVKAPGFCVMAYEARRLSGIPVSTPEGLPWADVSRDQAKELCSSLGDGFKLISNADWQTIANDVILQPENWSSGHVGSGCVMMGNSGEESECSFAGLFPNGSGNPKSRLVLSTGSSVWDMSGNLWEWVADDSPVADDWGPDGYMGALDYTIKPDRRGLFGPADDYTCTSSNHWCGFGYGRLNYYGPAMMRGGMAYYDNDESPFGVGIFAADVDDPPYSHNAAYGFRCTYRPI